MTVGLILVSGSSAGFAVAAAHNGFQSKAKDVLFRCIERANAVALSAIVVQKGSPSCPTMQVKIEQDKAGRRKTTILQPLSNLGIMSEDDGKVIRNYYPDENRIVEQPSPRLYRDDTEERMELAEKNYRFSLERNGEIAGRPTWVVTATPRSSELPSRKYSIDLKEDVLLRLETVDPGGRKTTHLDTLAIRYPESNNSLAFNLKSPIGQVRIINVAGPIRIENAGFAKARVGFEPVMPKDLPFGFIVREPQLTGDDEVRFVAVRITDGLVTATVYQWRSALGDPFGKDTNGLSRTINGVRIRMVGDLPDAVNGRILDLFAKEAARAFRPPVEPTPVPQMLKRERTTRGNGAKDAPEDGSSADVGDPSQVDEAFMQSVTSFLCVLQSEIENQ